MSLINVTASGNNLLKTGGCDGCSDATAVSEQQLSGSGLVAFSAPEAGALRFVGLGSGGVGTEPGDTSFALRLQSGVAEVRETGAYRTEIGFAAGDVFQITIEGGVVKYWKNGGVFYTSGAAAASALRLHVAIFNAGAAIGDVRFTGAAGLASTTPASTSSTTSSSGVRQARPRPAGSTPVRRR